MKYHLLLDVAHHFNVNWEIYIEFKVEKLLFKKDDINIYSSFIFLSIIKSTYKNLLKEKKKEGIFFPRKRYKDKWITYNVSINYIVFIDYYISKVYITWFKMTSEVACQSRYLNSVHCTSQVAIIYYYTKWSFGCETNNSIINYFKISYFITLLHKYFEISNK